MGFLCIKLCVEVTEKAWFKNVNASWQRLSYLQDQQFPITQAQ